MQRYLSRCLLFVGFLVAVSVYLLTGAFVPYPGASSSFLAATLFPTMGETFAYPLDALCFHWIAQWVPATSYFFWVQFFCALCCGLGVALMLSFAQITVDTANFDSNENNERERLRAQVDRTRIKRYITLFSIPLAVTIFPFWVMGTRPLEGCISMLLAMASLWFGLNLRRRYAVLLEYARQLQVRDFVFIGICFYLMALLLALAPSLALATILPFLFSSRVFVVVHFRNRVPAALCALGGIFLALLSALLLYGVYCKVFFPLVTQSSIALWATHVQSGIMDIIAHMQQLEGACVTILYALGAAIFFESFPRAFYKAFTPVIGQFSILIMCALPFIGWPTEYWSGLTEMDPFSGLAFIFIFLNVMVMVASWARNWLDVHAHWTYRKTRLGALAIIALPLLPLATYNTIYFAKEARADLAQPAMETSYEILSSVLPKHEVTWVTPAMKGENILLARYVDNLTIHPLLQSTITLDAILLDGMSSAQALAADPLLKETYTLGNAAFVQYLMHSEWADKLLIGDLFNQQTETLIRLVDAVKEQAFSSTYCGQRWIQQLRSLVALQSVREAIAMPPSEEMLEKLRQAVRLDPENQAAPLSIEYLRTKGLVVTQEEFLRSRAISELNTWLLAPNVAQAERFEASYGPVLTAGFNVVHRLRHLLSGVDVTACLDSMKHLYRETPEELSLDERLFVLVHLSPEEALPLLDRASTTKDEIVCYLLDHLHTPESIALYEKNRDRFEYKDRPSSALDQRSVSYVTQFYGKNVTFSVDYLSRNIKSFYSRDGEFSYGLYYVKYLISRGAIEEAYSFITDFYVRPKLEKQPLFKLYLSRLVLKAWIEADPQKAFETTQLWLSSDPLQPLLWTLHLQNPAMNDAQRLNAAQSCLSYYPQHPVATRLFADHLQQTYGEEIANRYLATVELANQRDKRTAPHAHR